MTPRPKFAANVPSAIQTPDTVDTRIGTLRFTDGMPDNDTVQKVYDQLDFNRGIDAFLTGMPGAALFAACDGVSQAGAKINQGIGITETLMDARSLFLTPNSTNVYAWLGIDLKDGPVVVQVPPAVLGPVNDAYFRYVADVGFVGDDKGKGGKYLFVPPDYKGELPKDGYFVKTSQTYRHLMFYRAFVKDGDMPGAVANVKANARVYPLSATANPPETTFVNLSGVQLNTIHANDFHFYEELNAVVQHEPADWVSPDTVGLFAAIGIKKGQPFAPDARMKALLTDAVAVGNATARAILFASRDKRTTIYPDRRWFTAAIAGHEFLNNSERMLDARVMMHYYATGVTPAMFAARPGSGSAYLFMARDTDGRYFDGGKTYKVTLPGPVPAGQFWAFTVYDNQHRSLLETDQKTAGLDSTLPGLTKNADGSTTVWFGPEAPAGQEGNWVQTMPGKGWNTIFRLYAPLQPWFDQSWRPGDFELVN